MHNILKLGNFYYDGNAYHCFVVKHSNILSSLCLVCSNSALDQGSKLLLRPGYVAGLDSLHGSLK